MIRFIIKHKQKIRFQNAEHERIYTLDAECPELEAELSRGGFGEDSYDTRQVLDTEILKVN